MATRKLKLKPKGQALTMINTIQIAKELFPPREPTIWNEVHTNDLIPEVTAEELIKASKKLKTKKAPGLDGIPAEVLQTAIRKKPEIFCPAFNNMMQRGEFPESWKFAKLALIEKPKKIPNEKPKYRPICLLNTSSKLLEHIIRNRLEEDLNLKENLSERQYGFRADRSTTDAVKVVTEILKKETQKRSHRHRKIGALITLDIKNAFNSAPWKEIVKELENRGTTPYLIKIIMSYLSNRKIVLEAEEKTIELDMTCGVPQGSVLGPTLWNILYDGLLKLEQPKGVTLVGYADDIAAVIIGTNIEEIQLKLDIVMMNIQEWLQANHLQLAVEKTELVLISMKKRQLPQEPMNILGNEIYPKNTLKYLGVWIDRKLCFTTHVEKTIARASQTTMALARIMPNIGGPQADKRKVLSAVTRSILLYAAPAWAAAMKTKANRKAYQRIQRQTALRICSAYRTTPTEALLVIAEQPPVDLLIAERKVVHDADQEHRKQIRIEAKTRTLQVWQERWTENGSEESSWTKILIPQIERWINRKHGNVNFYITQFLTGHGSYRSFTHKIGKTNDNECTYCGEVDTAQHTIFYCPNWVQERNICQQKIEVILTEENIITEMIEDETKWKAIASMIGDIMKKKSQEERDDEYW